MEFWVWVATFGDTKRIFITSDKLAMEEGIPIWYHRKSSGCGTSAAFAFGFLSVPFVKTADMDANQKRRGPTLHLGTAKHRGDARRSFRKRGMPHT